MLEGPSGPRKLGPEGPGAGCFRSALTDDDGNVIFHSHNSEAYLASYEHPDLPLLNRGHSAASGEQKHDDSLRLRDPVPAPQLDVCLKKVLQVFHHRPFLILDTPHKKGSEGTGGRRRWVGD